MSKSTYLRSAARLLPLYALLAGLAPAAAITYQVSNQGGSIFRYQFSPVDLTLLRNQELDIRFDPTLFANLSNGVAGADFRLFLLQPDNPPGAFGDYSALALVDHPSLAGTFSVDVTFLGAGTPGDLPFIIDQFDSAGLRIVGVVTAGTAGTTAAPEPASWLVSCLGFATLGCLRTALRRLKS